MEPRNNGHQETNVAVNGSGSEKLPGGELSQTQTLRIVLCLVKPCCKPQVGRNQLLYLEIFQFLFKKIKNGKLCVDIYLRVVN